MMLGKVLGESWHIYKRRFGIMLFFSFIFIGLGSAGVYLGQQAIYKEMYGFSTDIIQMTARLLKGVPVFEQIEGYAGQINPFGMGFAGMGITVLIMMALSFVSLGYSLFCHPIFAGGVTVLATGERGALSWRDVLHGIKSRYWKLMATYLCYLVYNMAAGFAVMIVFVIVGVFAAIVFAVTAATNAGILFIAAGATLSLLLLMAAGFVVNVLGVFIAPAAVFDRQYYFKAVGRSISMAWKHFFPVLWVQFVTGLLIMFANVLLYGLLGALAFAGPSTPVYMPLFVLCMFSLVIPFNLIVNGVLYRHIQERDEQIVEAV